MYIYKTKEDILTNKGLIELYCIVNREVFNNKLPSTEDIIIEYSNRMSRNVGICNYDTVNGEVKGVRIAIGKKYHYAYPEEIEETLLHEMVHVELPYEGHSNKFIQRCKELSEITGVDIRRYSRCKLVPRWKQTCKDCGEEYTSYNRANKNYLCSHCRGELIEEKYVVN